MRVALIAVFVLLVVAVPSAATQSAQPCTAGASSIAPDGTVVTTWYPPDCIHP